MIEMNTREAKISLDKPKVDADLIYRFWTKMRCTGPDIYQVVSFGAAGAKRIQHGWLPKGDESIKRLEGLVEKAGKLETTLVGNLALAYSKIKSMSDFYELSSKSDSTYALYCKSDMGVVGVGFYVTDGDIKKAKLLAMFVLYAYGLLSAKVDKTLWDAAYRHLPYWDQSFDLNAADELFADSLMS